MTDHWKQWATLCARLASLQSVEALSDPKKLKLMDELDWITHAGGDFGNHKAWRRAQRKLARREALRELCGEVLPVVHARFRDILARLCAGEVAFLPRDEFPTPFWTFKNGVFEEGHSGAEPVQFYLWHLYQLFHVSRRFPFGRCPVCGAFFVRVKRQRYCSPSCAYRAIEGARKDARREHMRQYMANKRHAKKPRLSARGRVSRKP